MIEVGVRRHWGERMSLVCNKPFDVFLGLIAVFRGIGIYCIRVISMLRTQQHFLIISGSSGHNCFSFFCFLS